MTTRSTSPSGAPAPRPPGTPTPSALLGKWVNTDQRGTKSPLALSVAWHEEGMFVRAFGAGSPQPRDWGEAPAVLYTPPGTSSAAWSFSVVYAFGSVRTVVSAYHKTGILVATTSTVFSDDGAGADHWARSFFHRAEGRA
jgi:hypothetical protein